MRDVRRVLRNYGLLVASFGFGSAVTIAWPSGAAIEGGVGPSFLENELDRQIALVEENRTLVTATTDILRQRLAEMDARLVALDATTTALSLRAGVDTTALARDLASAAGEGAATAPSDLGVMLDAASAGLAAREQQLEVLAELLRHEESAPRGLPVAAGRISSRYGSRPDPFTGLLAHHRGIDIAGRPGTPIVAVASGVVTWSGPRNGYGETIELMHGNSLITRYAHNAENLVDVGDYVRRGQIIARLGGSGRATAPNLHYEVLLQQQAVDPLEYVD